MSNLSMDPRGLKSQEKIFERRRLIGHVEEQMPGAILPSFSFRVSGLVRDKRAGVVGGPKTCDRRRLV